jgi:hypothetical protein
LEKLFFIGGALFKMLNCSKRATDLEKMRTSFFHSPSNVEGEMVSATPNNTNQNSN